MRQRVQLDETLLGDLHQFIGRSPDLLTSYETLPEDQRDAVDDRFLDLIWDIILTNASGRLFEGNPTRSVLTPILTAAMAKPKR